MLRSLVGSEMCIRDSRSMSHVRILERTSVYGAYDHGIFGALETKTDQIGKSGARMVLWKIYSKTSILAAGATERPIAFANNDRPGIMLASAVRTYQNRFDVSCGDNTVLLYNNNNALSTTSDIQLDIRTGTYITDTKGRNCLLYTSPSPRDS